MMLQMKRKKSSTGSLALVKNMVLIRPTKRQKLVMLAITRKAHAKSSRSAERRGQEH
jgi:hypothetical protein